MKNNSSKLKFSYTSLISLIFLTIISSAFILLCGSGSFPSTVRLMTSIRFVFIILSIINLCFVIYLAIRKKKSIFISLMLTLTIFFASGMLYSAIYSYISTTTLPFLFGVTAIETLGMFAKGILMLLYFLVGLILCSIVFIIYLIVKHVRKRANTC